MGKLLVIFLLFSGFGFAQVVDAELWTGLGLKADLNKKLSLKYETQGRFNQNVSVFKTYYNELSLDYELIKNLGLGVSYRYSRRNRLTHFISDNRFCLNLEYEKKITDFGFKLKTRARYQYSFDRLKAINNLIFPDTENTFRLKFELKYKNDDFKRLLPSVGYELFKSFKPTSIQGINSYRLYAKLDFDLPARHEIALKYIYEKNYGSAQEINHIYMIQYGYSLSSKLFKKKKKK